MMGMGQRSSLRDTGRNQLPLEVAAYVRELIISGAVQPGEFLRMDPIAEAVGVSNTPVREGLLVLRSEGFLRLVPRRGFVVAPFGEQDVRDLFWAQARLAGELAARAAHAMTVEVLADLDVLVDRWCDALDAGDQGGIALLGHEFHRRINLAAGAHRLAFLLGSVVNNLPNRFYAAIESHVDATQEEHRELLASLRGHDVCGARVLMEAHVGRGADRLLAALSQSRNGGSGTTTP
jgi:DNA-binding GntR family transcriptional regulator